VRAYSLANLCLCLVWGGAFADYRPSVRLPSFCSALCLSFTPSFVATQRGCTRWRAKPLEHCLGNQARRSHWSHNRKQDPLALSVLMGLLAEVVAGQVWGSSLLLNGTRPSKVTRWKTFSRADCHSHRASPLLDAIVAGHLATTQARCQSLPPLLPSPSPLALSSRQRCSNEACVFLWL
jgi:hypothetical protein